MLLAVSILERSGAGGLRVLSLFMGVFLISMGLGKLGWLMDSSFLVAELRGWWGSAPALSRWYIDTVAIPGAPLFARLVLFGELASGAALESVAAAAAPARHSAAAHFAGRPLGSLGDVAVGGAGGAAANNCERRLD